MVPERVRCIFTTGRASGIFLDLPLGQLWSDFDDFYSVGKLLKKQTKNVTLSEIWLPLLTRVIPFWSSKKLSSNSNFYRYDTWFKNSWKTLTCTFILRICLQKKCTFALTDQNSPRNQKIRREIIQGISKQSEQSHSDVVRI